MKSSFPIHNHAGNMKQALSAGIKSGFFAGICGALLFGTFITLYFAWLEGNILGIILLPYILAFGIPIGMFLGAILGTVIGYVVYKNNMTVRQLIIYSVILGAVAGTIYPIVFIFGTIIFRTSLSPSDIQEAVVSFVEGLLSGGMAGLIGSKLFLRFLNKQPEIGYIKSINQ